MITRPRTTLSRDGYWLLRDTRDDAERNWNEHRLACQSCWDGRYCERGERLFDKWWNYDQRMQAVKVVNIPGIEPRRTSARIGAVVTAVCAVIAVACIVVSGVMG